MDRRTVCSMDWHGQKDMAMFSEVNQQSLFDRHMPFFSGPEANIQHDTFVRFIWTKHPVNM